MSRKPASSPVQDSLFGGNPLTCPGIENIPLIVDPHVAAIEVLAPGSLYQPLLLDHRQEHVDVGPGKLDENEEAFVRDLIRRLYPAGNHPKSARTPLRWGNREIWLKRNIEKREDSFRLRVDDSNWFYPDFIVWILDHDTRTQTFGFVDPKGLMVGAGGGWSDYKVVATLYLPHVVERRLAAGGQKVEYEGEEWTFRVRGVLVSTTSYATLSEQAKFRVHDEEGRSVRPTEADFRHARIVFQNSRDLSYIDEVLELLTEDTVIDHLLSQTAELTDNPPYFIPSGEFGHDLALRHEEHERSEAEFVAELLLDYLRPDADGNHGVWTGKNRRRQLMDHAREGILGFGGDKVADIRDHPTPCEELWKRKRKG